MKKTVIVVLGILILLNIGWYFKDEMVETFNDVVLACTEEAKVCPDGSVVVREGPQCEFAACPPLRGDTGPTAQRDNIQVYTPRPGGLVRSPVAITGQARGPWFFEASMPVRMEDWRGNTIAQGYVTAEDEWITEDFVPFSGTLVFTAPFGGDGKNFQPQGVLIIEKSNPSGIRELDDRLEIPVEFASVRPR